MSSHDRTISASPDNPVEERLPGRVDLSGAGQTAAADQTSNEAPGVATVSLPL
jgi:hypothetical protein